MSAYLKGVARWAGRVALGMAMAGTAGFAHAALSVTPSITDGATTMSAGMSLTYTITFLNNGDVTIPPTGGGTFKVDLPVDASVTASTCSSTSRCGSLSTSGQTITMVPAGNLAPGQSVSFTLDIRPSSVWAGGAVFPVTASFLDASSAILGTVTDNNTVLKAVISYSIGKFAGARYYAAGQTVTYSLSIGLSATGGNMPSDVVAAHVRDTVPAILSNVQWSCQYPLPSSNGGCFPQSGTGNQIDTDVGGGTSGGSTYITLNISGTLGAGVNVGDVITNTATVDAIPGSPLTYQSTVQKSASANFTVGDTNSVVGSFTKTGPGEGSGGIYKVAKDVAGKVYTVTFSNLGAGTYQGTFRDVVPAGFTLSQLICGGTNAPTDQINCGNGPGVTVTVNNPGQNINLPVTVPPVTTMEIRMIGTATGPLGSILQNTAYLDTAPGLTFNGSTGTVSASAPDTTIVGSIVVNSTVSTNLPNINGQPETSINGQPVVTYTFTNAGTQDANALRLSTTNNYPVWTNTGTIQWTCAGIGGAVCPAASGTGTGNNWIDAGAATGSIPAGGRLVFTVTPPPIPEALLGSASSTWVSLMGSVGNLDPNVTASGTTGGSGFRVYGYNIGLTKTDGVNSVVAGQPLTYTIQATNGNATAQPNVRITDALSGRMTNASWTCSASGIGGSCSVAGGTGDVDVTVTVPASGQGTVTVTVNGNADPALAPGSTLGNTAFLYSPSAAVIATATDSDSVTAVADIGVTKVADRTTYNQGGSTAVVYTVKVTNYGASTAVNTPVIDTAPANVTFNSWTCDICAATSGTGNINTTATLAQNQTAALTINATVGAAAAGTVTNTATASNPAGYTQDSVNNHPKSATASVDPLLPQLLLTKQATPASFVVGAPSMYTLTVTNQGIGPTTAASIITDTIPTELTLGALPAGCTAAGQAVTCTIAAGFASGEAQSFNIPVTATASAIGAVTNTAQVSGGGDAGCPAAARCNASVDSNVDAPQLQIEKTAGSSTFVIGVASSYTLKVTNIGSAATTAAATVTDTLPASMTPGAMPAGCTAAGQIVTCTIATGLAAGAYQSFIIPVTPNAVGTVTNTAQVSGGGDAACPVSARCQDSKTNSIDAPQLTIVKTSVPTTLVLNQPVIYVLTVTNTGAAATTSDVSVTDTLPTTLTLGALPAGCSSAGQTVTCTIPAGFAGGGSTSFSLPVVPTVSGTPLVNSASVSGGGDPACTAVGNCKSDYTVNVSAPQLKIVKTSSATSFIVGSPASYTLTVTNQGDAATTAAATVSDLIPAQLTLGALPAGCSAVGQQVTCTITAGLAVGGNIAFTIPVTPASAQQGVVNTATVIGGGDPGCPADSARCTSSITVDFNTPVLTLIKTASVASFTVGVPASYTLRVTNSGTVATTAVATISDIIPADFTLGTMPAGCAAAGQAVTCTIAAGLAVGGNASFVIPVTLTGTSASSLINTATVSGGGDPGCPAETRCTGSTTNGALSSNLVLDKTASAATFVVGVPASYTLTVTNNGTATTASAATVTDVLPAQLTPGTMPAGCTLAAQTVTCTVLAGLAISGTASFVIPVTPNASAFNVPNTAHMTGGAPDCTVATPCDSPTIIVDITAPHLTIAKTASDTLMAIGVPTGYTLTVTNEGTAATTAAAIVSDTLNSVFTIDNASLPAGCSAVGQTVTCTIASGLPPSQQASFMITVTPNAAGTAVPNTAGVTGGGDPACQTAGACTASVNVDIVNGSRISVDKSIDTAVLSVGTPAAYTITVTNTGSTATPTILIVDDPVPDGLTLGTLPGDCTAAGQNVSCQIAAGLAAGASVDFVVPVTPNNALPTGAIVNTATVSPTVGMLTCAPVNCQAQASATRPGLPPPPAPTNIPALSPAMLALLTLLLAALSCAPLMRRHRRW